MKKVLLSIVAVLFAAFAIAQDYPVVSSVEELYSHPEGTVVLFENIEVSQVPGEYNTSYFLPDDKTTVSGNVFPVPALFSAVGALTTEQDYMGKEFVTFEVQEVVNVSNFFTLADLINFASRGANSEVLKNSPIVKSLSGNAIVSCILGNYVFYYTSAPNAYGGVENVSGVMYIENVAQYSWDIFVGANVYAPNGFYGSYAPSYTESDEDGNVVDRKGGCFTLAANISFWAQNSPYDPVNLPYESSDLESVHAGYMHEAQLCRFAPGGTFVERDGKYFYEQTITIYGWDPDTYEETEEVILVSIEVASANDEIDLSTYVGAVCEKYLCGVWDYCNTGDTVRLLLNDFMDTESHYKNLSEFISLGSNQWEEEIPTVFDNPLTVTYKYDDGGFKFVLFVEDESGALALEFGAYGDLFESEYYEALKAINVGDAITGVKGFAQYNCENIAPYLTCAYTDYSSENYDLVAFVPTVVSSDNAVEPAMTVTVADMINDWTNCQENGATPKIANNVVRLLDVKIVDDVDEWGDDVKYLIQNEDTMVLSNLWGADKMNFQTFEHNNIIGIADYKIINMNGIYQFMPLSQEHITDASLVPEVTTREELEANPGTPLIIKNVEIELVASYYYSDPYIFGDIYVAGFDIPGVFDLYGLYEDGGFSVYEVKAAHSFATISGLDNFVANYPDLVTQDAYNVTSSVVVTHVEGDNVFVQFAGTGSYGQSMTKGTVLKGLNADVKQGDEIQGLKGMSTPCDWYTDAAYNPVVNKGSSFTMAEDAEIVVLSSDNDIDYGSAYEFVRFHIPDAQGAPVKLKPTGEILEDGGRYYYREEAFTYDAEWNQIEVTYIVELVSSVVDLSELAGADIQDNIVGVLDYKNTTDDEIKIYVHGLASTNIEYQNIGELIAAGPLTDYSMTVSLKNPVIVTYIYKSYLGYMTVQDETGAILLSFSTPETADNYAVGDEIQGIKGCTNWSNGTTPMIDVYDMNSYIDYTFTVLSQGNIVEPVETTIATLNEEYADIRNYITPTTWVSKLVRLNDVEFTMGINEYDEEWPCLKQGDDVLFVVKDFGTRFGLVEGDVMDITGVIDYYKMNPSMLYTIHPRSADDIYVSSALEGVVAQGNIYLDAAYQVVAPGAVAVALYDINGRQVATTDAAGLAEGVYVVRATYADGSVVVAKVVR